MRKAGLGSEACQTETAAELALGFSAATAAVKVMTFGSKRMRRECRTILLWSALTFLAKKGVSDVAFFTQSHHACNVSWYGTPHSWCACMSNFARHRMSIVDICPYLMSETIRIRRNIRIPPKRLSTAHLTV